MHLFGAPASDGSAPALEWWCQQARLHTLKSLNLQFGQMLCALKIPLCYKFKQKEL